MIFIKGHLILFVSNLGSRKGFESFPNPFSTLESRKGFGSSPQPIPHNHLPHISFPFYNDRRLAVVSLPKLRWVRYCKSRFPVILTNVRRRFRFANTNLMRYCESNGDGNGGKGKGKSNFLKREAPPRGARPSPILFPSPRRQKNGYGH